MNGEVYHTVGDEFVGSKFGRWTVLGEYIKNNKQERKWLCRCECGTERYVLERGLKYGSSQSCGCLRKENHEKAVALDLSGKQFGELTVLERTFEKSANRGVRWLCQCSCGNAYVATGTLLVQGKKTHCGCKKRRDYNSKDITGKKFSKLTALYPMKQRDERGSVIWHCRCDCGNEVDVSYNVLMYTHQKSCGCQKKEFEQHIHEFLTHIDGTSVDILQSKKIPVNNTTGVKGVYFIRGKYVAKIVFQKKQYFLGAYESLEEAAVARQEAEKQVNDVVVAHYNRWKDKAEKDSLWAQDNPIYITVTKDRRNELVVDCFPKMPEEE